MFKIWLILVVNAVLLQCLLVHARSRLRNPLDEKEEKLDGFISEPVFETFAGANKLDRSIRKRDAFDDLLDLDEVRDMDIYRDLLVGELDGEDRTIFDQKLVEAENTNWKHKSAFHRYAMRMFAEVKKYHTITSKAADYNV